MVLVYLLQRIPAVPSTVFISPLPHSLGVEAFVSLSSYLQPIVLENPRDKGLPDPYPNKACPLPTGPTNIFLPLTRPPNRPPFSELFEVILEIGIT